MSSSDRIHTTHVGSLPRSAAVADLVFAREKGDRVDDARFEMVIAEAVKDVVSRQAASGVDMVSDGEMSKISYATYIKDRVSGFDGDSPRIVPADLDNYPRFMQRLAGSGGTPTYRRPRCVAAVAPKDDRPLAADLAALHAALAQTPQVSGFMNSAAPGVISLFQPNEHYATQDEYLEALAEAMRPEYEAIVASGLILQIDSPDLGLGRHTMYKSRSEEEYLVLAARHVDVLNHALRNIPADKVRMHICWGNYEGPHDCDIELAALFPVLMRAKPLGLLFETSNPRHAADWTVFVDQRAALPEDKVLIPGVIDSTTNFVEHPRLVAERLMRFAEIVGRERVMAGTDCGFSTFAGFGTVDEDIVYAKLKTMADGAAIATERLWKAAA